MRIHTLRPAEGAVTPAKRLGRGTGSGLGKTENLLRPLCSGTTEWLNGNPSKDSLAAWVQEVLKG